ncbi:50S ribosomal protein L6 [Humisphaera borealis]|uniref:Large ribosomal subunit protein uL6 n=1 Tax=Humisphaera borealis TaxID=2807512 RepID=A0A7M2WRW1_9BACT|nr:50S ribosomal protein L6 [Humisphaera borealis]QOV88216.1 50S ribosomal protein L6 [Humisphaera borealis]
MSRLGKKPVAIGKAKVTINGQKVNVEGAKGKLEITVHPLITVKLEGAELVVTRPNDERQSKALHGLTRALLANMVEGATTGYKKTLEIQGVGYKAEMKGKNLVLSVGFANPVTMPVPANVQLALEGAKMHITGADKQAVGQFAAEIRKVRKPEPYKGKGIRYEGEQVKIKPGKAFAGAGAK